MLYKKTPGGEEQLNTKMFVRLSRAFRTYTDQRVTRLEERDAAAGAPLSPAANNQVLRESLKILLSAEGNYLQDLLLREVARMGDAAGRQALVQAGNSLLAASSSLPPLALGFQA